MSGHVLVFPARVVAAATRRESRPSPPEGGTVRWWSALTQIARAVESRRALRAMDDRMLSDVGLSRAEALTEAGRWPWDVSSIDRCLR